jgi:hypothetical protein
LGVRGLYQDDVAVVFGVVSATGRAVGRDELLDEFLDGGIRGIIGGELVEVFGGFESDHISSMGKADA